MWTEKTDMNKPCLCAHCYPEPCQCIDNLKQQLEYVELQIALKPENLLKRIHALEEKINGYLLDKS